MSTHRVCAGYHIVVTPAGQPLEGVFHLDPQNARNEAEKITQEDWVILAARKYELIRTDVWSL